MTHDEMARELYEKEKPKQPIAEPYFYGVHYNCPNCKCQIEQNLHKYSDIEYCFHCGQSFDWSFLNEGG